jgi:hypothetical protein
MKRREHTKPNALDVNQYEMQQSEGYDEKYDMIQPSVKFASLKEQALSTVIFLMMTQHITMM